MDYYPLQALTAQPEARAREKIDRQLTDAGWIVQDRAAANLSAGPGVAVREFPLKGGPVDYLLYLDGAAAGAVEAKDGRLDALRGRQQSKRYSEGLPGALPAYRRPLPFLYESTGVENQFTNLLDPEPRSRDVSTFDRPETHREWLQQAGYERSRRAHPAWPSHRRRGGRRQIGGAQVTGEAGGDAARSPSVTIPSVETDLTMVRELRSDGSAHVFERVVSVEISSFQR